MTKLAESIAHVRECAACSGWVESSVGPKLMRRQSRLAQYCCAGLFSIIEEPRKLRPRPVIHAVHKDGKLVPAVVPGTEDETRHQGKLHLELAQVRAPEGEIINKLQILIDGKRAGEFPINYCPWCAEKPRFPDQVTYD